MEGYTQDKRSWVLEKYRALVDEMGSQAKACRIIGISDAVMSQIVKDTYKGRTDDMLAKLYQYFVTKQEAATAYDEISYAPTSISQNVYAIIHNCKIKGGLAIAAGDAGIGKTKAAKKYEQDNPTDAIYIQLNPCITGIKPLLKTMCGRLGVSKKTTDEMWMGAAEKLRDGMVLIFDEAQHLPIKSIEMLRSFSDYFNDKRQTLGIALVGNTETVYRFGGRKEADFAQIANRTKQRKVYYARQIVKSDIQLLFPALSGKDMELELLLNIAQSQQALRGAMNLYSNAYDNEDTSYDGLIAMAKHMELEL